MSSKNSSAGRPAYYTLRQAAWMLGVTPDAVSRAIRIGMLHAVRRGSRLMVPASEIARQIGDPPTSRDDSAEARSRP
jgi:hypothetical protein